MGYLDTYESGQKDTYESNKKLITDTDDDRN